MEPQTIRDERREARLEPTLLESDPLVPADEAAPAFHPEPTPTPNRGPGDAVANRYLLRERLGRGHFGEIYEAVDLNLSEVGQRDHCVALERVTLSRGQADVRRRLADEFLDLRSLSHPNLATILDFGVDGTTTFFTTELLEGVSLRSILDSNPTDSVTENELLAIIRGLSDGLSFLHEKGIIHGDLQPESVFVTTDYEVKIVDLPSVRLARARDGSTEMRFGGSLPLDVAEDVFGLACVTYEWLSNEHPFGNASPYEAFRAELSPRRIKGLPRFRWKALSHALDLQQEARTQTIAEFASDFGVMGTETLAEADPKDKQGRRGFLRPVLLIGAIAGLAAMAQSNFEQLSALFATLQAELADGLVAESPPTEDVGILPQTVEPLDPQEPAATVYPYPGEAPADPVDGLLAAPDPAPSSLEAVEDASPVAVPPEPEATVVGEPDPVPEARLPTEPEATLVGEPDPVPEASLPTEPSPIPTPLSFAFAQDAVTVSEADSMASIVVERSGGIGDEASMVWWTGEGTASANDDYADLGTRTETFAADQDSLTVYVPLVSDALIEQRESFNVYLSWESAPSEAVETLEVFVIDDDS